MNITEARQVLAQVRDSVSTVQWGTELTTAVQRALAELYLLNPYDDVDGKIGPRTREAWRFLKEATNQTQPYVIDAASSRRLIDTLDNPAGLIGTLRISLQPDFEFRRRQRQTNRERSVAAIVRAAEAQGLTKPQLAYILATAEHESDSFNTLEEYTSGEQYEGRRTLGNDQSGDGRRFKGRGYVQLTGRRNYTLYAGITGLELVKLPVLAMNWPSLSVFIIVDGMMRGVYTGRRLDQFVNAARQDFFNARQVVNGHDRARKIADQASDWLRQLG
jgi:hypothetical protein